MNILSGKLNNHITAFIACTALISLGMVSFASADISVPKNQTSGGQMKLIKGVDPLKWENGGNTFIASLAASLRAKGEKISYVDLMGLSGAAFRLQYYLPHGCPSSPDATCGFNCMNPALAAMGYTAHTDGIGNNKEVDKERVRKAVVDSINKGNPVLGIEMIGPADWGVITGCEKEGEELLCRTYHNKTNGDEKVSSLPWAVCILDEKKKAPAFNESFKESLKLSVLLAKTDKFENYASGYAAYEAWQKHLLDAYQFSQLSKDDLNSTTHMNAWIYSSLIDARSSAMKYLRNHKDAFGAPVSVHLANAADLNEKEMVLLSENRKYAPFTWELKENQHWTQADRDKEAKILGKALSINKAAVAEIESALQMIDPKSISQPKDE